MMNTDLFAAIFPQWIRAFAFSLVVEVPLFVLLGCFFKNAKSGKVCSRFRLALAGAAGTCITHPLLWFVWTFIVTDYTAYIISGELLVAAVESVTFYLIARPIQFSRAVIIAVAANAASCGLGMLVYKLLGDL